MAKRETMKDAGYQYVCPLKDAGGVYATGEHILKDIDTGKLEVWFANKGHASYGIIWNNTDLEFARSLYPD